MKTLRRNDGNPAFSSINITNLVDVALTLVVVLLIIAPFIEQGIEVKLPASSPGKVQVENSIVVTVAPDNVYFIDDKKVTLRELYNILKERKRTQEKLSLIVKGDETVSYRNIVRVLDISKKCEIETIGLATRVEAE
jgi:biopolymer transport protein ExbD